jgi:biopolymer transport protein ExbD
MSAVDLGSSGKSHAKETGPRKPQRTGFKLDMTPLVDVAFLLLTFFMFATTMSRPTVMDIRMPPTFISAPQVSESWTLIVTPTGKILERVDTGPAAPISLDRIESEAVRRNLGSRGGANSLVTVMRVDPAAPYESMVGVMDRLNSAEEEIALRYKEKGMVRDRKFTVAPFGEEERKVVAAL